MIQFSPGVLAVGLPVVLLQMLVVLSSSMAQRQPKPTGHNPPKPPSPFTLIGKCRGYEHPHPAVILHLFIPLVNAIDYAKKYETKP